MKPIDLSGTGGGGTRGALSNSSPSKYSKISLTKMSSASLIYKRKMDRLMHSIKVQCVYCENECTCNNKAHAESILEEENADDNIYGQFHQHWEEFIDSIVYIHQLKLIKLEDEYVPSRWRIKDCDK